MARHSDLGLWALARLVALAAFVCGLGMAGANAQAPDDGASLDGFDRIEIEEEQSTADRLIDLIMPFIGDHPESTEGRPTISLDVRKVGETMVFDLETGGYLDDSVAGEHVRGHVIETSEGWKLIAAGAKWICWRGQSDQGLCN